MNLLINSHLQPAIPYRSPILRIPAPISEVVAVEIKLPRKKSETRRLVSDFLYHVDIV